jgi:xylan 1,4-beta-xylosidase
VRRFPSLRLAASLLVLALCAGTSHATEARVVEVHFADRGSDLRPLHGINKGPLAPGGLVDVTEAQRQLRIPWTRLHDCHWPNPDVVDIHAVFSDANADALRAESYDFARTDEYVSAVRKTGAQIIYRLGESIEHERIKKYVHPPANPEQWAAVCLGIIRHYNEGWANGFRHGIEYWEIWNEPENRPAMWTGTDVEYFALYATAARAIKAAYPNLKIGGPSIGATGSFEAGVFKPSAFLVEFLRFCRRESLPLDFFSWHCYTDSPSELVQRAKAIRSLLNQCGFTATESHLNEWNYLPDNSWDGFTRSSHPEERQRAGERMMGREGAAFIAAALLELQEAPVDICNFFHGEVGSFGLFNEHGVPSPSYFGVLAFAELARVGPRVRVSGDTSGRLAIAGTISRRGDEAAVLISNQSGASESIRLRLHGAPEGGSVAELLLVDGQRKLEAVERFALTADSAERTIHLPAHSVGLVKIGADRSRPK